MSGQAVLTKPSSPEPEVNCGATPKPIANQRATAINPLKLITFSNIKEPILNHLGH